MPSASLISGSDVTTIWMSSTAMNMPSVMAEKPTQVPAPTASLVRHCRRAACSARMRIHSTSAFSTENTMPYHTRPKQSGSTRISAATMQ